MLLSIAWLRQCILSTRFSANSKGIYLQTSRMRHQSYFKLYTFFSLSFTFMVDHMLLIRLLRGPIHSGDAILAFPLCTCTTSVLRILSSWSFHALLSEPNHLWEDFSKQVIYFNHFSESWFIYKDHIREISINVCLRPVHPVYDMFFCVEKISILQIAMQSWNQTNATW